MSSCWLSLFYEKYDNHYYNANDHGEASAGLSWSLKIAEWEDSESYDEYINEHVCISMNKNHDLMQ